MTLHLKRIYEPYNPADGFRIFVDRLWARGLSKEKAHVDLWLKAIAPSTSLRQWFGHDPAKWTEFQRRYQQELKAKPDVIRVIKQHLSHGKVTLVYGAKDKVHNDAVVLKQFLETTSSSR